MPIKGAVMGTVSHPGPRHTDQYRPPPGKINELRLLPKAVLPPKGMLDVAQHGECAVGVVAVVPVLIGHERGDQNAYRCPSELAHDATLWPFQ